MKVYLAFYWFILIQIIMTDGLYWVYFATIVKIESNGEPPEPITLNKAVALVFLPTILMVISYSLMYYQLEKQMKLSRIQSGQTFMRRFKKDNVELVKRVVLFSTVGIVTLIDAGYLVAASYAKVSFWNFQLELSISTLVLVVVLNTGQLVTYCSLTGSPYKPYEDYRKVRRIGIACGVWSVAFFIKFTAALLGDKFYELSYSNGGDFWSACYLALFTIITEIIPLFMVIDGHFVRIMTGDHLEADTTDAERLL